MAKKRTAKKVVRKKARRKTATELEKTDVAAYFKVIYSSSAVVSILMKPAERWTRQSSGRVWQKKVGVGEAYADVKLTNGAAQFVFRDVGQTSPNYITVDPTGATIEIAGMGR